MEANLDAEFTHSIINFLGSALQGKFAQLNVLLKAGSERVSDADLKETEKKIRIVKKWRERLWAADYLISASWKEPDSEESREAFAELDVLRAEFREIARSLQQLAQSQSTPNDPLALIFIASCFGRHAYMRDNFVRGFVEFATKTHNDDLKRHYARRIKEAEYEVDLTHSFLDAIAEGKTSSDPLVRYLLSESLVLPGVYLTRVHDIAVLKALFEDRFTFDMSDINPAHFEHWVRNGVPAEEAGEWYAHGIEAEEAVHWMDLNIPLISSAEHGARWKLAGFSPHTVARWPFLGLSPFEAAAWHRAGYTPEQAKHYVDQGVISPAQLQPTAQHRDTGPEPGQSAETEDITEE